MIFFNIDLHISVIADLKRIFSNLGHEIVDKSLSGHTWVFNRQKDNVRVISQDNWKSMDIDLCNRFYNEYRNELNQYDGFVCTYPPSFALLYERFNKPIVLQVPIRFEVPFQNNPSELKRFIDFLQNGIDNKQIIPICNSLYDKKYCEKYTNREWKLIPNICDYAGIDNVGGWKNDYIVYSRKKIDLKCRAIIKEQYLGVNYSWHKFDYLKGVIHFPYNVSTMSIFEQYTGNVPLFFPTPEFNLHLYKCGLTLSELSWSDKKEDSLEWIKYADYYNEEWMPYIKYFSSFEELYSLLDIKDNTVLQMRDFNVIRKKRIYDLWRGVL
jgi:hypothetical protein